MIQKCEQLSENLSQDLDRMASTKDNSAKTPTYLASFQGSTSYNAKLADMTDLANRGSLESINSDSSTVDDSLAGRLSSGDCSSEIQSNRNSQPDHLRQRLDSPICLSVRNLASPVDCSAKKTNWHSSAPMTEQQLDTFPSDECQVQVSSPISVSSDARQSLRSMKHLEAGQLDPNEEPNNPKPPFLFAGILASLLGSLLFSISITCVKAMPDHTFRGSLRILSIRGIIIALCSGLAILYEGSTIWVKRRELWINAARCSLGITSVLGSYCAMHYLSLGDTTALIFSSPIWTSLLSRIILKEPLNLAQIVALPFSLVGILLVAHPSLLVSSDQLPLNMGENLEPVDLGVISMDAIELYPGLENRQNLNLGQLINSSLLNSTGLNNQTVVNGSELGIIEKTSLNQSSISLTEYKNRWPGIVIALTTSILISIVYIVLKFRKSTSIQTVTFWLGITMSLASSCLLMFSEGSIGLSLPVNANEWILMVVNGVFSWGGQSVLQWAILYESAAVLSVVRTMDVAVTFLLSALFVNDPIYWTSVLGSSIIALSVAFIVLGNLIGQMGCPFGLGRRRWRYQKDSKSVSISQQDKVPWNIYGNSPPDIRNTSLKTGL